MCWVHYGTVLNVALPPACAQHVICTGCRLTSDFDGGCARSVEYGCSVRRTWRGHRTFPVQLCTSKTASSNPVRSVHIAMQENMTIYEAVCSNPTNTTNHVLPPMQYKLTIKSSEARTVYFAPWAQILQRLHFWPLLFIRPLPYRLPSTLYSQYRCLQLEDSWDNK